jgi:hypothetical protein
MINKEQFEQQTNKLMQQLDKWKDLYIEFPAVISIKTYYFCNA